MNDHASLGLEPWTNSSNTAVSSPIAERFSLLQPNGHVRALEDLEREAIVHAILFYGGEMSEVARRLRIGRSTLYRKIREHGIEGVVSHRRSKPNPPQEIAAE